MIFRKSSNPCDIDLRLGALLLNLIDLEWQKKQLINNNVKPDTWKHRGKSVPHLFWYWCNYCRLVVLFPVKSRQIKRGRKHIVMHHNDLNWQWNLERGDKTLERLFRALFVTRMSPTLNQPPTKITGWDCY